MLFSSQDFDAKLLSTFGRSNVVAMGSLIDKGSSSLSPQTKTLENSGLSE
jgi:hypothetical protein